ncbi:SNF2 family N-terminal domain-containing protein [Phascolomyces articulosus]|uniref:SNF2 family N-terminal domain-containing protein n=1 Tax=Phascolomyces articulosus TaxID=60185 RepID=A0AAD5K091_9FUNG|nr:SNF2 family N-terminal domain-containing protein [Phascolomyces articulosus]
MPKIPADRPRCRKCERGYRDTYRLVVRSDPESTMRYLFHGHRDESLQSLLLRLCEQFPKEWFKDIVYYFYIDIGGSYYPVEHSFWLRDKDHLLVTTIEDESELPDVSMNAVHADLRSNIKLQPHQEEGVERMISMERSYRGGILADDMGLGKTLQMLTLIMRQQPKLNVRAPTLVVVPSRGVADQWAEEIRTKTTYGSIPYFIYNEYTLMLLEQPCFRVVITTYDRVRAEFRNRQLTGVSAPLIDMDWHRVILDESNKVRTMKTAITEAVLELKTRYRWCLTGTPLQNEISELYPIFAFLEVQLANNLKHNVDYISTLLKQYMVRRTKKDLQSSLTILPQKEERVVLEFSEPERALYDYLERVLYKRIRQSKGSDDDDTHTSMTAAALLYLRLKQTCGHFRILLNKFPDLIPMVGQSSTEDIIEHLHTEEETRTNQHGEESEVHEAFDVIESFYDQFGEEEQPPDLNALQKLPFLQHSTKVGWLIQFLKKTLDKNVLDKIVVVTQFVDLLQVISNVLASLNIRHNCYHGDMSGTSRMVSLRQFNHQAEVRVMLLSLKAGGVGLNLQRANHMVILDRWWNPATMDQAIARIHRMTQNKQTFIHTVVIKDTVEEGLMDNVLKKKSELFKTIVENNEQVAEEEDELLEEGNFVIDDEDEDADLMILSS